MILIIILLTDNLLLICLQSLFPPIRLCPSPQRKNSKCLFDNEACKKFLIIFNLLNPRLPY